MHAGCYYDRHAEALLQVLQHTLSQHVAKYKLVGRVGRTTGLACAVARFLRELHQHTNSINKCAIRRAEMANIGSSIMSP